MGEGALSSFFFFFLIKGTESFLIFFPGIEKFLSSPLPIPNVSRTFRNSRIYISRFLKPKIRLIYARNMHAVHVFVTALTTATGTLSKDNMCSDNTSCM